MTERRASSYQNSGAREGLDTAMTTVVAAMRPVHAMTLGKSADIDKVLEIFVALKKMASSMDNDVLKLFMNACAQGEMLRFVHACFNSMPALKKHASPGNIEFPDVDISAWNILKETIPQTHAAFGPLNYLPSATKNKNLDGMIAGYVSVHTIMVLTLQGKGLKPFGEVLAACLGFLLDSFIPTLLADTLSTLSAMFKAVESQGGSNNRDDMIGRASESTPYREPNGMRNMQYQQQQQQPPQVIYCCSVM